MTKPDMLKGMFANIRRSWQLLSPREKITFSFLTLIRTMVNGLDVIAVALVGVTAAVFLGGLEETPISRWFPSRALDNPGAMMLLIAVLFVSKTAFGILLARWTALFLAGVEHQKAQDIARAIFLNGIETTKKNSRSEIDWTLLRSTEYAFQKTLNQTMSLFSEGSLAVALFILLLSADWQASTIITLYFLMVLAAFSWLSNSKFRSSGKRLSESSVSVVQVISDLFEAFREIAITQKTNHFLDLLADSRRKVARANATYFYLQAVPRLLAETALIVGALLLLSWEFIRNGDDPDFSTLGVLLVGSLRIMSALLPLQRSLTDLRFLQEQADAAQSALEQIDSEGENGQTTTGTLPADEPLATASSGLRIELRNLTFGFEDAPKISSPTTDDPLQPIINGVTLEISPGSYVALIGPSGAGKTTLVDVILGLYKPSGGAVLIEGLEARTYFAQYPGVVGYVPQNPGIVSGTLAQNIALGVAPDSQDEEAIWSALQAAHLDDFVRSLPNGLSSDLGPHADALSGGQKQRLGLARALYTSPRLLILDEATSSLDAETESSVTASLEALRGKVSIVVVAHRLSTVQSVDKAYVLVGGKILAAGTFSELRRDNPLVRRYVDLMSFTQDAAEERRNL